MDEGEFIENFNRAIAGSETIVFSSLCSINYSGRAESRLEEGDRIIIIKSDKTLLVHQPTGSNPINYMKEGSQHALEQNNGFLVLKSRNPGAKEYLDICIKQIHFLRALSLSDSKKLQLAGSERDMADMLYNSPELVEPGFKPLSREEHTKYGFIDLFGYDKNSCLVVVECKRYAGDMKAVSQLARYVKRIKRARGLTRVRGILACPRISPAAAHMLADHGFKFIRVNPPKYLERDSLMQKNLDEWNK